MHRHPHNRRNDDAAASRRPDSSPEPRPYPGAVDHAQVARLGLSVFAVLMSYYLLKPAREALLVGAAAELAGAELRGAASVAQGIFAVALAAVHGRMAGRLPRRRLIGAVNGVCAAGLVFVAAAPRVFDCFPGAAGGVVVYVASGAAGVMIIAQFWAFAADVEGGRARRMLPILSFAASAGGLTGALLSKLVVARLTNPQPALFVGAAATLALGAVLAAAADRGRVGAAAPRPLHAGMAADDAGLRLGRRYVLAAALVTLLAQWVGTNGENLLFGYVQSQLSVASLVVDHAGMTRGTMAFYATFSLWSNLAALALQLAVACGCARGRSGRDLLLVLPVVTLVSATAMIFVPALCLVKCLKVAENATRYSIHNTAAQLLWLPAPPAMKYKAKVAIETVVVRLGDALAALTAFVGLHWLHAPLREMYVFQAALVVVWAIAVIALRHAHEPPRREANVLDLSPSPRSSLPPAVLQYDVAA
jgi:AAA family ATP:ADP antiporter